MTVFFLFIATMSAAAMKIQREIQMIRAEPEEVQATETIDEYQGALDILYFREFSLTAGERPAPQLVCKVDDPADGCEKKHMRAVECARQHESAWVCKGHEVGARVSGLEFQFLRVTCEDQFDAATCSLHYTIRHSAAMRDRLAEKKLRDECQAAGIIFSPVAVAFFWFASVFAFAFFVVSAWIMGMIVADSDSPNPKLARIKQILRENQNPVDEEHGKMEKLK